MPKVFFWCEKIPSGNPVLHREWLQRILLVLMIHQRRQKKLSHFLATSKNCEKNNSSKNFLI
jgi:hypothetical protein